MWIAGIIVRPTYEVRNGNSIFDDLHLHSCAFETHETSRTPRESVVLPKFLEIASLKKPF